MNEDKLGRKWCCVFEFWCQRVKLSFWSFTVCAFADSVVWLDVNINRSILKTKQKLHKYTHTNIYTHMRLHSQMYTHSSHMHNEMCTHSEVHYDTNTHAHVHTCKVKIWTHAYKHTHTHTHGEIHGCTHTYTHTHTHTHHLYYHLMKESNVLLYKGKIQCVIHTGFFAVSMFEDFKHFTFLHLPEWTNYLQNQCTVCKSNSCHVYRTFTNSWGRCQFITSAVFHEQWLVHPCCWVW